MNEYTAKKIGAFMGILKKLGLEKVEICGICSLLETEDMLQEMVDKLEEKNFETSPQETLNICARVIKKHRGITDGICE